MKGLDTPFVDGKMGGMSGAPGKGKSPKGKGPKKGPGKMPGGKC